MSLHTKESHMSMLLNLVVCFSQLKLQGATKRGSNNAQPHGLARPASSVSRIPRIATEQQIILDGHRFKMVNKIRSAHA